MGLKFTLLGRARESVGNVANERAEGEERTQKGISWDDLEMRVAKGKEATGLVNRKNGWVTVGGGG